MSANKDDDLTIRELVARKRAAGYDAEFEALLARKWVCPHGMSDRRAQIRDRILACVEIVDDGHDTPCWLWTLADSGSGRGGGYPRMKLNDRTCAAHKVSFVNEHGYVPGNKQVDHLCRNRRCVNPDHLEMISHIENQKRRDAANGVVRKPKRRKARAA